MADTKKVTKKDMFKAIIELATTVERDDIVDFATREIELLDKRYAAKTGKVSKAKQEAHAELEAQLLEVLAGGEPMRIKDIAEQVGITPQKASPRLAALAEAGKLTVTTEKRIKMYQLVTD